MRIQRVLKIGICSFAAICMTTAACAYDDLTIPKGSPLIVTDDQGTKNNLYASDSLTVSGNGNIQVSGNDAKFGVNDGDQVGLLVDVSGSGGIGSPRSDTRWIFGKVLASPAVDIRNAAFGRVFLYNMDIAPDAVTGESEINFMSLSGLANAVVNFMEIKNLNAKSAVINFNQGGLLLNGANKSGFVLPSDDGKIVLNSVGSRPIRLLFPAWGNNAVWQMPFSSNLGTVETRGGGDVVFGVFNGNNTTTGQGGTVCFNVPYDDGRLVWGHAGDIVFTNAMAKTMVDNSLPYSEMSPRTLRFGLVDGTAVSATQYCGIDLNGHSSKVGNLYMGEGTFVTNSSTTVGTLVLGADAQRSVFRGTTCGNVVVEGAGVDYEIAAGSDVAKLKASVLPVNIATSAIVREIEAANSTGAASAVIVDGEAIDITGFRAEPVWNWEHSFTNYYLGNTYSGGKRMNACMPNVLGETHLSNGLHRVSVSYGGTAVVNIDEDCDFEYLKVSGDGAFRKAGSGRATLVGDTRLSVGRCEVYEGTLALQGAGCTNEWYRLTVTQEYGSHDYVTFGKIGLFDGMGNWLCLSSAFQPAKSEAALLHGEFTVGAGLEYDNDNLKSKYYPGHLFVADYAYYGAKFTNRPNRGINSAPIVVTFRLPASTAPAMWHSVGTVGNRGDQPMGWKLETSANGVDDWIEVVSVSQDLMTGSENWYYWRNDRRYNDGWNSGGTQKSEGLPWRLSLNNALASGNDLGVVRVDARATLDLTGSVGTEISRLEVDVSLGGGTIRNFRPASEGRIDLVNVVGGNLSNLALIDIDGMEDASNLRAWDVYVNGVKSGRRVMFNAEAGKLVVAPIGFIITFK